MLHALQFAPFADAARQRQYEAICAALAADASQPTTLLLGNLEAPAADAVLLQPHCLVLLLLRPAAGCLTVPASPNGAWLLDGQPLPGPAGSANPVAQYQVQLPAVRRWLAEQLGRPESELPPSRGVAVFNSPLTFGLLVEKHLHQAAPDNFELLGSPAGLPQRLRALPATPYLTEEELTDWATYLQAPAPERPVAAETPAEYLLAKLRQLWQWLGAADVPADPPYGSPATPAANYQEQARLQEFRQELQAELRQLRQEAAARETAYQQELLRLQQQVLQAGSANSAQQAQAADAARQAAQAELEARTQELNQRIGQLSQLIGQLQAAPAAAVAPAATLLVPATRPATTRAVAPRPAAPRHPTAPLGWRQLRPAERWGLLGVAVLGAGLGFWKLTHQPPMSAAPARQVAAGARRVPAELPDYEAVPARVYVVDSSLAPVPAAPAPDTAASSSSTQAGEPAPLTTQPQLPADTQGVNYHPASAPPDSML